MFFAFNSQVMQHAFITILGFDHYEAHCTVYYSFII
jgi:hypothetical protein